MTHPREYSWYADRATEESEMTDKEKVLAKYPDASCCYSAVCNDFVIQTRSQGRLINISCRCKHESSAWANAVKRIRDVV